MNPTTGSSFAIRGYNFQDNKLNVRVGPHDGYLRADMSGYVPTAITVCARFNPIYNRYGDQPGIFGIFTPYDDRWPVYNVQCPTFQRCRTEFHGHLQEALDEGAFPKKNWLRKWTSMCVGVDFIKDETRFYLNGADRGQKSEELRKTSGNPLIFHFPEEYFSGRFFTLIF